MAYLTASYVATQLLNGFALGMLFVLMAVGLTIILGLMRVINFAHGALYALGAYLLVTLNPYLGFWGVLVVGPLLVAALGAGIEFSLIRPLYGRDPLYTLLLTFGLALLLEELVRLIWGDAPYPMAIPALLQGTFDMGFAVMSIYRVFIIVLTTVLLAALWFCLEKTQLGRTILAGTFDREMVVTLGVPIGLLLTLVFALGAGLAAFAGILSAPIRTILPGMGTFIIMPSFVVVIIGGMGSFWGAVLGGILVGEVITITVMFWSAASEVVIYVLLAVILLIRPRGMFGIKGLME